MAVLEWRLGDCYNVNGMRILVSGAGGFIGSHLVQSLISGHEVYALDLALPDAHAQEAHWITQDLSQPIGCSHLPARIDAVVHLAQSRFYRQFPEKADDIFNVNVVGTFRMLEYARAAEARVFVQASSGGIYGLGRERFVETDPTDPPDFYQSSKCCAEMLALQYLRFFRTAILRLFFVYGPNQTRMLIPSLLQKVQDGQTIVIEGNPGVRVNPVYVEDVVRAVERVLELELQTTLNIAGDEIVTITDLVSVIERAVGKKAIVEYANPSRPGDLVGDNSRMKAILGIHPRTSLLDGVRQMI
jgi:nucleoside-diphosphate-sugar epimerase